MENTMASSNVDDKLKKDTENKETGNKETNKILTFIKQNVRYITAGVLFLAMVLILVKVGSPKPATEWTECCGNRGSFRGIR